MIGQILLSGVTLGSIYSLFGVGLVILYRGTTMLNFSQGEFFMLGAYLAFTFSGVFRLNYALGILFSLIIICLLGGAVFIVIFKKLMEAPHINQVLATVGLVFFFQGVARIVWGSDIRFLSPLLGHHSIEFMGFIITSQDICILTAVSIFTVLFAWIFLSTKAGKIMQAASQTLRGAALAGINVQNFHATMWIVSTGIAALAGILIGPLILVMPEMGGDIIVKALAAITLGGFGSIPGALVGGVLMGIIENMTAFYISTSLREISGFLVIIVILLIKPTGILGVRRR